MSQFEKKNEIPDQVRALLVAEVQKNWPDLLQAMVDLAKGIYVEDIKMDSNGSPVDSRVYQKSPDRDVAKYLMDQVIGKPKESMNIEGKINLIMDEDISSMPMPEPEPEDE